MEANNNNCILSMPSAPDKVKIVLNDGFELCGEFDSMMEYIVSIRVKELNTAQLKALYGRNITVNARRTEGWFVIISKKLIKEVDFYEC